MTKMTIVALLTVLLAGSISIAAERSSIAVANAARIFDEMQEMKDIREKLASENRLLTGLDVEKRQKLQAMQEALNALKPDAPQYKEKADELTKARIEYETWARYTNESFQREQMLALKQAFQKIEAAIAEVAKQKGIAVVITDNRTPLPDNLDRMNMQQLQALINSRAILYADDAVDISSDVLALLDARYRESAKPQQQ